MGVILKCVRCGTVVERTSNRQKYCRSCGAKSETVPIRQSQLTLERLKEFLFYNPDDGVFTWVKARSNRASVGSIAGGISSTTGYVVISLFGRWAAHRLAYFYMTGVWPKHQIDHRDTNKANNRWANLREATNQQNAQNRPAYKNNKCGKKGVHWNPSLQKWRAQIRVGEKRIHLGVFPSLDEAAAAYSAAAERHFGEFARE